VKVVFAGTPAFAAAALQALSDAGHTIQAVLTQPDRPAGRGMKLQASAVKQLAQQLGFTVLQPEKLRSGADAEQAMAFLQNPNGTGRPDVMVVAAYGLILPKAVLDLPLHGCLNIHASLLPRWRGAAPIHRAIEAGDSQTGITIMQMDEGLDTGDMLRVAAIDIGNDNTGQLHDRLAALGASEIVAALAQLEAGTLSRTPQPAQGVTYANKITREESRIDWSLSAQDIRNRAAAFDPHPGCVTHLPESCGADMAGKADLKLFDATVLSDVAAEGQAGMPTQKQTGGHAGTDGNKVPAPGTILALDGRGLAIACGQGAVLFASAQRPGGRRMPAQQALAALNLQAGICLDTSSCP
jgi:methionyl-tRNA formyltransferase